MNSSRAFDVLLRTENRLTERFVRVINTLEAPARIKALLVRNQARQGGDRFNRLWRGAAELAASLHVKRRDTDWVFDNFWPNAREPKHSKLLGFFLDPRESHECGLSLLQELLPILENAARESDRRNSNAEFRFIAEGCVVEAESGGYIDLRIERERADSKFAIIIENKINGAPDQVGREAGQLETYVAILGRRFAPHQIYVFYLPLEGARGAKPEDINAITKNGDGVTYAQITFEKHIMEWLEAALREGQPPNGDLREHLSYYARLITYLVNKNKQVEMDSEILKTIQETEETGPLSLSEIDAAVNSAISLRRVFARVLRGRLLRRIHGALRKEDSSAAFYTHPKWPRLDKVGLDSDYADEFDDAVVVGVTASAGVIVGFGWDRERGFFFAYLRLLGEHGPGDAVVQQEANIRLGEVSTQEAPAPYYAYKYEEVSDEQCEREKTAGDLAQRICELRDNLRLAIA